MNLSIPINPSVKLQKSSEDEYSAHSHKTFILNNKTHD